MKFVQRAIKSTGWWLVCAATSFGFAKLWLLGLLWLATVFYPIAIHITPVNAIWETVVSLGVVGGLVLAINGALGCAQTVFRFLVFLAVVTILSSIEVLFSHSLGIIRDIVYHGLRHWGIATHRAYSISVWLVIPTLLAGLFFIINKKARYTDTA